METIELIFQAEEKAKQMRADAVAAAKLAVSAAEDEGRAKVEAAAKRAEADLAEYERSARKRSEEAAETLLKRADEEMLELRRTAEGRLEQTADYIVERIVNS